MNDKQKKELQKLIQDNKEYKDNTDFLRDVKVSSLIKKELNIFLRHKHDNNINVELLQQECKILYNVYPEIFNKITTDNNFNFQILYKLISLLNEIESGKYDQNEASFHVGNILKELYIDPVINKPTTNKKNISYEEYKNKYL